LKKKVTPLFFVSNYDHEDRNLSAWRYGIKFAVRIQAKLERCKCEIRTCDKRGKDTVAMCARAGSRFGFSGNADVFLKARDAHFLIRIQIFYCVERKERKKKR